MSPKSLSQCRILVSNDDGMEAPGLRTLERIAKGLSPDTWVVAPEVNQSATGRSMTVREPLRIRELAPRRFAVNGRPADCVPLALEHILKDQQRPHLILSGINEGWNAATDVTYSGTVGVAIEGTFHGIRSIALSLDRPQNNEIYWAMVEHFAPMLIRKLYAAEWPDDVFMNINFPHLPMHEIQGVRVVAQGRLYTSSMVHAAEDHWKEPCYWLGSHQRVSCQTPETDLDVLSKGYIAVTPLTVNLTHYDSLSLFQKVLPTNTGL